MGAIPSTPFIFHMLLAITSGVTTKGLCKEFFLQISEITMEVGGWVQVSFGIFFGKSSQNSPKPVY